MWALTKTQRDLLTRWFDGELDGESEQEQAEALLEDDEAAELWVSVLQELRMAARGAFREIRERSDLPASDEIAEQATEVPALSELPLEELRPLLEAYHDDAVTAAERRAVEALRDNRDDVAECLEGLDFIREGVRAAEQQARSTHKDLDLWSDIKTEIEEIDREKLMMQYADGELEGAEAERAESLLAANEAGEEATVQAVRQLGDAVRSADREVVSADLSEIWAGVDDALSDEWRDQKEGADVVSLDARSQAETAADGQPTDAGSERSSGVIELFSNYGQAMAGAAAAIVLMFMGGLLYQNFLVNAPSTPQKQVVIVDSVQEKSGSVQVRSVKPTGTNDGTEESKVIWLSEDSKRGEPAEPGAQDGDDARPATGGAAGQIVGERPDAGGLGRHNGSGRERANRDFPDGGTPIDHDEKGGESSPADNPQQEQVDKPGDGPI